LRTLRPTLGSEDERQRRNLTVQMSQHALIDLCKNEAQKHLVQGQYELAIPGTLLCSINNTQSNSDAHWRWMNE
jgi:hypothetical protein